MKQILANLQSTSTAGWSELIKKATDIFNDKEHSALYGETPEGVTDNPEIQYMLEAQGGRDIKHNNDAWRRKAGKLRDTGAFRVPTDRREWERIDAPKFKGEVHKVDGLTGANVEDTQGNSYPVRQVLAVPGTSADIDVNDELIPASGKREQQRRFLRPYAEQLRNEMSTAVNRTITFARASEFLRTRPGFQDTAETYRLARAGRYVNFLRLFGFEIQGSGPAMTVSAPGVGASTAARGRPEGAIDLAPRVPRRGLPGATAVTFQPDNPFRGGTDRYVRYEAFRTATTVGQARSLGATPGDLKESLDRGFARLQ